MFEIDPQLDASLAREFMTSPVGLHSPNLQRLLRTMRGGPLEGKYALLSTKPGREWTLIHLSGDPAVPPIVYHEVIFTDLLDAEREVFRRRWKQLTGERLEL